MNNSLPQKSENNQIQNRTNTSKLWAARGIALNPIEYSARITRNNPSAIVILIDQSKSMGNNFFNGKSRAEAVADIVNSFFSELIDRCIRENEIRDYFDVIVIGYGNENGCGRSVNICWEGNLEGKEWVKISELKENVLRIDTINTIKKMPFGDIPSTESKKIWINPLAIGLTPMREAFETCKNYLEDWILDHQTSFPPLVFNITDGYPTDIQDISEIVEISEEIKKLSTNDGNTLLFNCLLQNNQEVLKVINLPNDTKCLGGNEYFLALFESSSYLPNKLAREASRYLQNPEIENGNAKGVSLNADANCIIQILDIGSNFSLNNAE